MARRVYLLETTELSPNERLEIYSLIEGHKLKSDTILGWSEGSECIKVFWDYDEDFMSAVKLPGKTICSDITDSDLFNF